MSPAIDKLTTVMANCDVKRVVIVDDAFGLKVTDLVDEQAWADFRSTLAQDGDVRADFEKLDVDLCEGATLPLLDLLYLRRSDLEDSAPAVAGLLSDYESQMGVLRELESALKLCDVRVESGADVDLNALDECDLAFIDFFLDPADQPDMDDPIDESFLDRPSVKKALELALAISKKTDAFIILMSSFQGVQRIENAFRLRTDFLMRGFFRFVAKEDLFDRDHIAEQLVRLPLSKQFRKDVVGFANAIESDITAVATDVMKTVRDLGVEDFAYLAALTLRKESHPLGDYLLRLVGSHLVHLLNNQQRTAEATGVLDRCFLTDTIPLHDVPSGALSQMYSSHVVETIRDDGEDGWARQPQFQYAEDDGKKTSPLADLPFVQFGDLLIRDAESEVYAIVNPGCDLMFGPERENRKPNDSVVLLPGTPKPLHAPLPERKPSSFLWLLNIDDGSPRRIEWDFRRFRTVEHSRLRSEFKSKGYKRNVRLRLGAAVELQQAFLAQLGRVGLETPPHFAQWYPCSVYVKGLDGKLERVVNQQEGMIVAMHRRSSPSHVGDSVVFTNTGRQNLSAELQGWVDTELQTLDAIEDPTKRERRQKYLEGVEKAIREWRVCFSFDEPQPFPGGRGKGNSQNKAVTESSSIHLTRAANIGEDWKTNSLVIVEVHAESQPATEETEETGEQ